LRFDLDKQVGFFLKFKYENDHSNIQKFDPSFVLAPGLIYYRRRAGVFYASTKNAGS
jgi:hypothetical protein